MDFKDISTVYVDFSWKIARVPSTFENDCSRVKFANFVYFDSV